MWPMKAPAPWRRAKASQSCGPLRNRHWLWAFPGLCLAVLVAGWAGPPGAGPDAAPAAPHRTPAVAASLVSRAGPGAPGLDGTGTMTVPPTVLAASGTASLVFTYTASAGQSLSHGLLALTMPPGWTPPSTTGPGGITVACVVPAGKCSVPDATSPFITFSGQQVTVASITLPAGQSVTITYGDATVQSSAGAPIFSASEQSTLKGQLTALYPPPAVTVTCADGTGTEVVSPRKVTAASTSTLRFTYTPGSGCALADGALSLMVPPGWTPPSAAQDPAGSVTTSPGDVTIALSGSAITVTGITLAAGQEFTIIYSNATAPGSATTATFDTSEQATNSGTPVRLNSTPQVTVEPSSASPTPSTSPSPAATGGTAAAQPTGGSGGTATGTMTVAPMTVPDSRPGTLTFTYQPPASGIASPGEVTLMVPAGWTPPSTAPGQAGYTTATPGVLSISGRQITVAGLALGPGQTLAITYRPAAAPHAAGPSVFHASERPGGASVLTALASSPSVLVGGPPPFHIPLSLLFVLLAAGCVAAVSAVRYLRHRTSAASTPTVAAVPQPGPPGTLSVQQTGTGLTHAVSIEPHPDAAVTTIEEMRP